MSTDTWIDDALVARMVMFVRRTALGWPEPSVYDEARAIVAGLLASVDPDLVTAREIVAETYRFVGHHTFAERALNGRQDYGPHVKSAVAALKAARKEGPAR